MLNWASRTVWSYALMGQDKWVCAQSTQNMAQEGNSSLTTEGTILSAYPLLREFHFTFGVWPSQQLSNIQLCNLLKSVYFWLLFRWNQLALSENEVCFLSIYLLDLIAYNSSLGKLMPYEIPSQAKYIILPISHRSVLWTTCLLSSAQTKYFSRTYIDHREALGPGWEKTDVSFPVHNFLTCDMHNTQSGCFPSYERLLQCNSTVRFYDK